MVNAAELFGVPRLHDDLERVEAALAASVRSVDPFVTQVAGHLAGAGGKRLRPALTIIAALAGGAEASDEVVAGGVAVELVHLGSLYHDDVMDDALVRRSVDSVNARWGNLTAILAGDFLLARASEIAASLGTEVAGLLAATIGRLCEGQVSELRTAFDVGRSEEAYLASIGGKSAALMATACRIGALVTGLDRAVVDAFTAFGQAFGMAFQIRDDILDVVASDEELGKPAGQDLLEGTYTLPVIRALAARDVGDELAGLLGRPVGAPERDKARAMVRESGAVAAAIDSAAGYAKAAAAALEGLTGPIADGLRAAPDRLLLNLRQ
jgi:heptaprenyl diphosphate synthase